MGPPAWICWAFSGLKEHNGNRYRLLVPDSLCSIDILKQQGACQGCYRYFPKVSSIISTSISIFDITNTGACDS